MTADAARIDLINEIFLLSGDKNPVISSNVPLRKKDGRMFADMANSELDDSGVAVYFIFKNKQMALACDKWKTPAENIRALGLTINALRGLDRWGSSQIIERAFTGFQALPEQSSAVDDIWSILGLASKPETIRHLKAAYNERLMIVHPDKPGGSVAAFHALQAAYKKAEAFFN